MSNRNSLIINIVKADIIFLCRLYRFQYIIPVASVVSIAMVHYLKTENPLLITIMLMVSSLQLYETMYARIKNEFLNYSLIAVKGKDLFLAKNISTFITSWGYMIVVVAVVSLFSTSRMNFFVGAFAQITIFTLFQLFAGNYVALRRIRLQINSISFFNSTIQSFTLLLSIATYALLTYALGLSVGFLICILLTGLLNISFIHVYVNSINSISAALFENNE